MKKLTIILTLAMILCLAFMFSADAVKIAPYSQPLHDIMHWDARSQKLIIMNPEGEMLTCGWPSTVDLWNYDSNVWTFDLPSGNKFAFSKRVDVNVSTTQGEGTTVRGISVTDTVGAALAVHEGIRSHVTSAFMTGPWCNAVVGVITYSVTGSAGGGMAAPICSEMNMQPAPSSGGSYYSVHSYFNVPTSAELIDSTTKNYAFELYELVGDASDEFDNWGDFWVVSGLIPEIDHVLSADYVTLRILVNPAGTAYDKFLVLSKTQNMIDFQNVTLNSSSGDGDGTTIKVVGVLDGTSTGAMSGLSSWLNIADGATAKNGDHVCAISTGIWEGAAAEILGAKIIFGMRMHGLIDADDAGMFCPFSINTANREITALFDIASGPSGGIWHTSDMTEQDTYVPLMVASGGQIEYVRIYHENP